MFRKSGREKSCLGVNFQKGLFKQKGSLYLYHPCRKVFDILCMAKRECKATKASGYQFDCGMINSQISIFRYIEQACSFQVASKVTF